MGAGASKNGGEAANFCECNEKKIVITPLSVKNYEKQMRFFIEWWEFTILRPLGLGLKP